MEKNQRTLTACWSKSYKTWEQYPNLDSWTRTRD